MSASLAEAKRALLTLLGGRWPPGGVCAEHWRLLAEMAAHHRLEPLLAWRRERGDWQVPRAIDQAWREARRAAGLVSLTQQAALRHALERLEAAGIPAVALKGVMLAWRCYPEPGLRPMRDLDLLVPATRAQEAAAILSDAGFATAAAESATLTAALADDHQLPAQTHSALGVTIELHHRLTDPPERRGYRVPQLAPEDVLARADTLDCGGCAVACPAPQDLAAHLIIHALYGHRLDCGPLVLADLHFLAATTVVDWDELRDGAEAHGWLRAAALSMALTERWFGTMLGAHEAPPDDVLAAAEEALLPDPSARDHAETLADVTAAHSPAALARTLVRRLAPARDVVAIEGGGAAAWAFWPVWTARRIVRLGRRIGDPRASAEARAAAKVIRWIQGRRSSDSREFSGH